MGLHPSRRRPPPDPAELDREGLLLAERARGTITFRGYRGPITDPGWERSWVRWSLTITRARMVLWCSSWGRIADVGFADPRAATLLLREDGRRLAVVADVATWGSGSAGTVEYRVRCGRPAAVLDLLTALIPAPAPGTPDLRLRPLDRLLGDWIVTGDMEGSARFRWAGGGRFLLRETELQIGGETTRACEVIGSGAPGPGVPAQAYARGVRTEWRYLFDGDELTIAPDGRGPGFRGRLTDGGEVLRGAWAIPGGGSLACVMRRPDPR